VHRTANDLETALARPRAEALLKTLPKAAPAATAVE